MKVIDLRSDTVTKPSLAMLHAMSQADVGDDVYGEDPTVQQLEQFLAEQTGMQAAAFAPSGTQSNLLAIMSHCERGDEYLVGQTAHTYMSEGGGAAVLGSVQPQPLDFEEDGTLSLDQIRMKIKPIDDHYARTRLLCLENTNNGRVLSLSYLKEAQALCKEQGLFHHLDGARVFNAAVLLNVPVQDITQHFDSVSICLSKGLGAPVGSVLCGTKELIIKARRWRKVLGGGMRQAGILAAAGIYALKNNVERLKEDHKHAQLLALALSEISELKLEHVVSHTNMVFIKPPPQYAQLREFLYQQGIIFPAKPNRLNLIRLVTHLDISNKDIHQVIQAIKNYVHTSRLAS